MISDKVTKKTLEMLGSAGSLVTGLLCAAIAVWDARTNQSIWIVWVVMSAVLVINGTAMFLHARRRDDSLLLPHGLPLHGHDEVKVRT